MHHALEIEEILLNIFHHCYSAGLYGGRTGVSNLVSLARTCRAFKDPALNMLWEVLNDLSPLAQCLPDASRLQLSSTKTWRQVLVILMPDRHIWLTTK